MKHTIQRQEENKNISSQNAYTICKWILVHSPADGVTFPPKGSAAPSIISLRKSSLLHDPCTTSRIQLRYQIGSKNGGKTANDK